MSSSDHKAIDWIALMRHAYDLSPSSEEWIDALARLTSPAMDGGLGTLTYEFEMDDAGDVQMSRFTMPGAPPGMLEMSEAANRATPPDLAAELVFGPLAYATVQQAFERSANTEVFERYMKEFTSGLVKDAYGFVCLGSARRGLMVTAPHTELLRPSAKRAHELSLLSSHLGAGFRLRENVTHGDLDGDTVDAILGSGGSLTFARGDAKTEAERLHHYARTIDRCLAGKEDEARALEVWEGLIDGRWSLVEHFDTDGKRFLVAHRNPPDHDDPRGLTPNERRIAEYFGLGRTAKEIAYTLGVSASRVDNVIARVRQKLGLSGREQLASFFSPLGFRRTMKAFSLGSSELAVASSEPVAERLGRLSTTERDIARQLMLGATTAHVAETRGVSPNTISTQIRAMYGRLGLTSRTELALYLLGA